MRRVFRLWLFRSVVPLFLIEFLGGVVTLYLFANLIFVGRVVDNALTIAIGNPFKLISYLWQAFLATRGEVQVIIVAMFLSFGLLLRNINRSIISYILLKRDEVIGR